MTAKQKTDITEGEFSSNMSLSGQADELKVEFFEYDTFNRLIGYRNNNTTASYTYYADNLRAEKTVNGEKTDFVWNGQNLAMENTAEITNTYTYDMTGIHIANQNGTVSGYLKDMHSNVVGKTDITGAKTEDKFDYSAFGINTEDTPDPFGYCGEYYDEETSLIYLRNRYYDSTTGRFITEDPAQDGLNWYVYCGGNPVMLIDSLGYWAENGRDTRFEKNNPIVYAALGDLTQSWENLDNLQKQGADIGNMKSEVEELANKVRSIGDRVTVKDTTILSQTVSNTEAVIYADNPSKGLCVALAAASASFPGVLKREYKDDGTINNAIKHATWNAMATISTEDSNYVRYFTNAHEYGYPIVTSDEEVLEHTKMDLFNNDVGRYQGALALNKTRESKEAILIASMAIQERVNCGGLKVVVK